MKVKKYSLNKHSIKEPAVIHHLIFVSDEFLTKAGEKITVQFYQVFYLFNELESLIPEKYIKKQLDHLMECCLIRRTGLPKRKGYFRLINATDLFKKAKEIK